MKLENTFIDHFKELTDPRLATHRNFRHNLGDMLTIAILGTICGADGWAEIERFGLAKEALGKLILYEQHTMRSNALRDILSRA